MGPYSKYSVKGNREINSNKRFRILSDIQHGEFRNVLAALAGSPELMEVRRRYQQEFIAKCAEWVGGFATSSEVPDAGYWAILGAAESLSEAVAARVVEHAVAEAELVRLIVSTIKRS